MNLAVLGNKGFMWINIAVDPKKKKKITKRTFIIFLVFYKHTAVQTFGVGRFFFDVEKILTEIFSVWNIHNMKYSH